jgi:hypothetical protein
LIRFFDSYAKNRIANNGRDKLAPDTLKANLHAKEAKPDSGLEK